jgi:hypothetical protein
MNTFDVEISPCGSAIHLADVRLLQERQLAIPHDHAAWPLHSTVGRWVWSRVLDDAGRLITGLAVHLTSSRAIPGTRLGIIERVGRDLHEPIADVMGAVLSEVARKIPRLLRLSVRIFDEQPQRRQRLRDSFAAAGWTSLHARRQYSHTLVLPLATTQADVLKSFSTRVRSSIRKALGSSALHFAPIHDQAYAARMSYLFSLPFARTGSIPPSVDIRGMLQDAASGASVLLGAYAKDAQAPEDLVAMMWGRLHGDHTTLEINASERSALFEKLSPGFGLMSELIGWSIKHNARWIDMGGLSSLNPAPDDPMRGVIEYKKRFASDFREVAQEWQLEPNPLLAAAASAVRTLAKSVSAGREHLERRW